MRLANMGGRATLITSSGGVDVFDSSGGRFGPGLPPVDEAWPAFDAFARDLDSAGGVAIDERDLGSPVPGPRQVFAVGVNYRCHAAETGLDVPAVPVIFTKFPACLCGPHSDVELSGATFDWEVELVVVIGARVDRVPEQQASNHIAGLTVGQDISDRSLQFAAGGQFSLGKSFRTFGPTGPWLVTADELPDRDDLVIGCAIDGDVVQQARTSDLIFGVGRLVSELSAVVPLLLGDLIFTGTPSGVGMSRQPPRFLQPGEILESWIEGIGTLCNRIVGRIDDCRGTQP